MAGSNILIAEVQVRIISPVGLVLAIVATIPPSATPVAAQSAPPWAQEQLTAWYAAFNAGDAKAVAALYASDAVLVPSGTPAQRGRAAIEAFHTTIHRETKFSCSGAFDGFQVVAGTAVGWGHDDCTETPRAGGPAKKTKGRWVTVYEKQQDGKWSIIRDVGEEVKP